MNIRTILLLAASHAAVALAGFAGGIYALPILIAPDAPSAEEVRTVAAEALFEAEFRRELKGSDALHWGEGTVTVTATTVSLLGKLSPGPDFKLYLSPEFVETEADFKRLKGSMVRVGDVKTFDNFVLALPVGVDPANYSAVVVWCESFSEFITAARYR